MKRRTRLRKQGLNLDGTPVNLTDGQRELLGHLQLRRTLNLLTMTDLEMHAFVQHQAVAESTRIHGAATTAIFVTHVGRLPTQIKRSKVVLW